MKYAFAISALTAVASGHSIFQQIVAGGTEYGSSIIPLKVAQRSELTSGRGWSWDPKAQLQRSMLF